MQAATYMNLEDIVLRERKERKVSRTVVSDSLQSHGLWPTRSSVHGILQARVLEGVAISFSRRLPDPGIKPGSPAFQADALTSEPPGKPVIYLMRGTNKVRSVQEQNCIAPGLYFRVLLFKF